MSVTRRLNKIFGPVLDLKRWVGFDAIREQTHTLVQMLKKLLYLDHESKPSETFEEAIAARGVTEDALRQRIRGYTLLFVVFTCFGLGFLVYALYHLAAFNLKAFFIAFAAAFFSLAQAFRCHFWRFQIKQRRLGCSFQEWWHGIVENKR